jgi:hypothetical protein
MIRAQTTVLQSIYDAIKGKGLPVNETLSKKLDRLNGKSVIEAIEFDGTDHTIVDICVALNQEVFI